MYTIIAPVPASLATAIDPYRQKYDPLVEIIPPHITIVPSFNFSEVANELLLAHLKNIGESHAPIRASLAGWDVDDQATHQFRLPLIAGRQAFQALYDELLTGPLAKLNQPEKSYWPHIPFAHFSTHSDLKRAKSKLKTFEPQFVFRVHQFNLLQRDKPNQIWQLHQQFFLEATVSSPLRHKKGPYSSTT